MERPQATSPEDVIRVVLDEVISVADTQPMQFFQSMFDGMKPELVSQIVAALRRSGWLRDAPNTES